MTRKRVLLLGGPTPLLQKAVDCGLDVVNIQKPVAYSTAMDGIVAEMHVLDYQDIPAVTALADRLHHDRPFDRVVSQTESAQLVTGYLTTRFGLPGNGISVTRTMHDKRLLRALLNERGLGHVAVGAGSCRDYLADFVAGHGAAVAKPPMASGSLGVRKVRSMAEVDAAWEWLSAMQVGEFMLEALLVGTEISVETMSVAGRHVVVAITGKYTGDGVVELEHVVPAPIPRADADLAAELTVRTLDAVGMVEGPAHTELILTADGPRVVETHSRRGGDRIYDLVDLVYGVDLERLAFQVIVEPIKIEPPPRPRGAAAIHYLIAEPGRITAITGLEDARMTPDVIAARVWPGVGDLVSPLLWSEERCGYVMTQATDAVSASAAARTAAAKITIQTEPVPGTTLATMDGMLAKVGEVLDPFATG